ncbi:DUF3828 domain-containing protein [Brevundimonas sp. NIBR11]|uniref:DUF3828 domain-containing protein n=1 Tax=Brevundimonas sp. NIBR11 TaxID=3015999 RepID=UPI0022F03480|nr:DUF3828 domain-containing protein [Brevundimonas sp. NIBR11]WGM31326.1 hypothetical protein KKHFBJBL_01570 [Brevundimonas sp. NIBR11]
MTMKVWMLGAAVLALAACSQPEDKAGAPATAAEAPATGQTPEAFVRSLYLTEQGGTAVRNEDPDAPEVEVPSMWSARTRALIAETEALGEPGEYAYFESDPICDCQDDGGMRLTRVTPGAVSADRADVTVVMTWTMAEPVETRTQTYKLVKEDGDWKIDDIVRDQTVEFPQQPLAQSMTAWIAEARAAKAQ